MTSYLVATTKHWNLAAFERRRSELPGTWAIVTHRSDLTMDLLIALRPRYIFFFHWSWIVPQEVLEHTECVCFHMTDVPFGRGGSPLQNLIVRAKKETMLTALQMTSQIDAGPVYMKQPLSLEGPARRIFAIAADQCVDMARQIAITVPQPVPQSGPVTEFRRRTPEESRLPGEGSLEKLYDHIRMLDAESYPGAFVDHGDYRITFTEARLDNCVLNASVAIRQRRGKA